MIPTLIKPNFSPSLSPSPSPEPYYCGNITRKAGIWVGSEKITLFSSCNSSDQQRKQGAFREGGGRKEGAPKQETAQTWLSRAHNCSFTSEHDLGLDYKGA